MPKPERHVFICGQTRPEGHPRGSCGTRGAGEIMQGFVAALTSHNLFDRVALNQSSCLGPCNAGANVLVYPEGVLYIVVEPEDINLIVEQHLIGGKPVTEKLAPADIW